MLVSLSWKVALLLSTTTNAFVPRSRVASTKIITNERQGVTSLHATVKGQEEDLLRQELAKKASTISEEDKYYTPDTEYLEKVIVAEENAATSPPVEEKKKDKSSPEAVIKRVTEPRAYPLFLAEKGAIIVEDIVHDFQSMVGTAGQEIEFGASPAKKERVVVLGCGWGAAAFLKGIDTNKFDVTIVSPRNFFLFTPMLAGASVGTVEYRSITEPVRKINSKAKFLEGTATEIDPEAQKVMCQTVVCEGNSCEIDDFEIEYDRLIMTVGAQVNTFGIPGVRDYCCFLKQVEDAKRIRNAIVNCFERANLPNVSDEERQKILTFAVIGAGPTGIEFASELRDFVEQDGPKFYPELLKYVRIKIIEASSTVLAPFDKSLQEEAIKQLTRRVAIKDPAVVDLLPERFELTELLLDSGVSEVKESFILLNNGKEIPYGLSVWAAGIGPLPITLQLIEALGKEGEQADAQAVARGRVAVDPWLRVLGGKGKILALGDCSCNTATPLPATAQVAGQQAEYLARMMSQNYNLNPGTFGENGSSKLLPPTVDKSRESRTLAETIAAFAMNNGDVAAPFQFLNLGILAYTGGGSALAQLQVAPSDKGRVKGRGKLGFGLWRSVYLSKQVSMRNRLLLIVDWTKTQIFGRDITRI